MGLTLRLLDEAKGPGGEGELLCCAYTPDGAFVLSGGWDGHLRLWETTQGLHVSSLRTGDKPVSSCVVAPDGKHLVSGGLDGLLAFWDALTHVRTFVFLAHPRPLSAVVFGPEARGLATSSWDGTLTWWKSVKDRDGKQLTGHRDIVAGCTVTPDGLNLLSWSHDTTLRLWDIGRGALRSDLRGHADRVHAAAVSPDGRWAVSGGRDGNLKVWDLQAARAVASVNVDDEPVACRFLLDGETVVACDRFGRLSLHVVPSLGQVGELVTKLPVANMEVSPASNQLALATSTGRVRLVNVHGLENAPLHVTAIQRLQRRSSGLQRLFGISKLAYAFRTTCPACRHTVELSGGQVGLERACPHCRRVLHVASMAPAAKDV